MVFTAKAALLHSESGTKAAHFRTHSLNKLNINRLPLHTFHLSKLAKNQPKVFFFIFWALLSGKNDKYRTYANCMP